jgi:hypothetical protein
MERGFMTLLLLPQNPRAAEIAASSSFGSPILIYRMAGSGASRDGMIFLHYRRVVSAYPNCGTGGRHTFCELRTRGWPSGSTEKRKIKTRTIENHKDAAPGSGRKPPQRFLQGAPPAKGIWLVAIMILNMAVSPLAIQDLKT